MSLYSNRFSAVFKGCGVFTGLVLACCVRVTAQEAQDPQEVQGLRETQEEIVKTIPEAVPRMTEQEIREQYAKSMTYMLRRAKLVRSLAAEHILYLGENADKPELHLVEEASQVIAFDLVCDTGAQQPEMLDQLATESTYRIAVQAGQSPIAKTLAELGQQQPVEARMELLGDIASTVFLFQVGRRRGLFDSLITDFGKEKFCTGMQANMQERFQSLTSDTDRRQ